MSLTTSLNIRIQVVNIYYLYQTLQTSIHLRRPQNFDQQRWRNQTSGNIGALGGGKEWVPYGKGRPLRHGGLGASPRGFFFKFLAATTCLLVYPEKVTSRVVQLSGVSPNKFTGAHDPVPPLSCARDLIPCPHRPYPLPTPCGVTS